MLNVKSGNHLKPESTAFQYNKLGYQFQVGKRLLAIGPLKL